MRRQLEKLRESRAAQVAELQRERQRGEIERQEETAERCRMTRMRAEANRMRNMQRIRGASARELARREGDVDDARDLAQMRVAERDQTRDALRERNRSSRDSVYATSAPENVRDFKEQERMRKAERSARLKAESTACSLALDEARRIEDERKRALHDAVRKAALGGFGDRSKTAYSDYRHSGTSLRSHSRREGAPHGFRHELPSARSPAGRWLREYARGYIDSRDAARSASSSPVCV